MSGELYTGEIDLGPCVALVTYRVGVALTTFEKPDDVSVELFYADVYTREVGDELYLHVRICGEDSDRTCVLTPEVAENADRADIVGFQLRSDLRFGQLVSRKDVGTVCIDGCAVDPLHYLCDDGEVVSISPELSMVIESDTGNGVTLRRYSILHGRDHRLKEGDQVIVTADGDSFLIEKKSDHGHKLGDTFQGEVIGLEQRIGGPLCTRVQVHFDLGAATTYKWFEEHLTLNRTVGDKVTIVWDGERFVLPRYNPLAIIEDSAGVRSPTPKEDAAIRDHLQLPPPDVCRFAQPQTILFKRPGEKKAKPFRLVVPPDRVPKYEDQDRPASALMDEARMMEQTDGEIRRIKEEIRATLIAQINRVMERPYCGHTQRNVAIVWRDGIAHWECGACAKEETGAVLRAIGSEEFVVAADNPYMYTDKDDLTFTYDERNDHAQCHNPQT